MSIDLMLGSRSSVAANLLTWAAAEMLRGMAAAGGVATFGGMIHDRVRPGFLREW